MARDRKSRAAKDSVCVGRIVGARGLKGEVRIASFTARPRDVGAYGPVRDAAGAHSFTVTVVSESEGQIVARLSGVADRAAAEALKGLELYVPRRALPPASDGEYYHADLIGLRAELAGGRTLGTVTAVHDYGAGASLEVALAAGGEAVMVPFTARTVPVVDVAGGRLVIDAPDGLLEPPARARKEGSRQG
jgi:16S rRNA processing protein RimM